MFFAAATLLSLFTLHIFLHIDTIDAPYLHIKTLHYALNKFVNIVKIQKYDSSI